MAARRLSLRVVLFGPALLAAAALVAQAAEGARKPGEPCRETLSVRAVSPCALTIQVHVTRKDMRNAAASETTTVAGCRKGGLIVGGGILQDRIDGSPQPINGLRIHGTIPSDASAKPARNGAKDVTSWAAIGGFGGQSEPGDQVRAFAMCTASGGPQHTVYVSKTVSGPTGAGERKFLTVSCPGGTRLIGGGSATNPASTPSLKPIGSFPSDASGKPWKHGGLNPTSWTAIGEAGGMQFGTGSPSTTVFAICDTDPTFSVQVSSVDIADHPAGPGNTNPGSDPFAIATAKCAKRTVLLGGGMNVDGNKPGLDRGTPQWGVH